MSAELISVVMPAYNAGLYIGRAIESVLHQTYAHLELIVVDDGSTDDTANIVMQYAVQDSRIILIAQNNRKQGAARNKAIQASQGSLIAFLDADDYWMPHKLEAKVQQMATTGADLVFSDAWIDDLTAQYEQSLQAAQGWLEGVPAIAQMLTQNRIPILTVLIKRRPLLEAGGFEELPEIQNAEDYQLWLKLLIAGKRLWGSPEKLACYRLHLQGTSAADRTYFSSTCYALFGILQSCSINGTGQLVKDALRQKLRNWLHTNYDPQSVEGNAFLKLYYAADSSTEPFIITVASIADKWLNAGFTRRLFKQGRA
jgi:hypothetical protein